MKSLYKYLTGMAAGAALVAGGGLAYSATGTAKYEPCRMTQPAAGVTQLCELHSNMASAANARGGGTGVTVANGSNVLSGGGSTGITVGGEGGINPNVSGGRINFGIGDVNVRIGNGTGRVTSGDGGLGLGSLALY